MTNSAHIMRAGSYSSMLGSNKLKLLLAWLIAVSTNLILIYQLRNLDKVQQFCQQEITFQTDNHSIPPKAAASFIHKKREKYNLMEEKEDSGWNKYNYRQECTIDQMNANKLPQDHPCVIDTIRKHYLNKPSPSNVPLNLDSNDDKNRSPGQTEVILRLLKNQTEGFFVECGALDGEFMSNTIDLERKYDWGGILIEANPTTFKRLVSRNRKAWTLPICLSLEPFPTQVTFQMKTVDPGHIHIEGSAKTLQLPGIPGTDPGLITIQCFPFYSVLLAIGRTRIDFFSLDVEGHELEILKTIPWHKVDIKTLTVEWNHIPDGLNALTSFMEEKRFITVGKYEFLWSSDVIFMQDSINTYGDPSI